ncbi:hypothetical protein OHB41_42320 [Streptomyces sp. NBC_01571]|uniref:hypothetical protein n=1 Tax=Streptomyces sp. NBC_01571 TaxID=2975883 RepID=UPI002252D9AF|nr:hypothetical protein [Streptomyces sp. NBC_01571]MCX4579710.1 hypothetical protein [Streptomyces sp. NBC_01571]
MTNTTGNAVGAVVSTDELIAAARELRIAGRWERATALLDSAEVTDARARVRLAVAAAEVALESDWFCGTGLAAARLAAAEGTAEEAAEEPTEDIAGASPLVSRWDLDFLRLRHGYRQQLHVDGVFRAGPDGKDPAVLTSLRGFALGLRDRAPDTVRRGWAEMYLGLIADNLFAEREFAPSHYEAALLAGEFGDDLLSREALRHLGDHDHDTGDHVRALERWTRATELGARAGTVPGTLSQQLLLAVLARDTGDDAGAAALAREVARWARAVGAVTVAAQAEAFLAGTDPTAPPTAGERGR